METKIKGLEALKEIKINTNTNYELGNEGKELREDLFEDIVNKHIPIIEKELKLNSKIRKNIDICDLRDIKELLEFALKSKQYSFSKEWVKRIFDLLDLLKEVLKND